MDEINHRKVARIVALNYLWQIAVLIILLLGIYICHAVVGAYFQNAVDVIYFWIFSLGAFAYLDMVYPPKARKLKLQQIVQTTSTIDNNLIDESKLKELEDCIIRLAQKAGLAPPELCINNSNNCFWTEENDSSRVIMGREMINALDLKELETIIAHELAHKKIANNYIWFWLEIFLGIFLMFVFMGATMLIGALIMNLPALSFWSVICDVLLSAIFFLIWRDDLSLLVIRFLERKDELTADALGAKLIGSISSSLSRFDKFEKRYDKEKNKTGWYSTHPSDKKRIQALKKLKDA